MDIANACHVHASIVDLGIEYPKTPWMNGCSSILEIHDVNFGQPYCPVSVNQ